MAELSYQLDLLKAVNHKLSDTEKMYRLICDSSNSAFIYYSYQTGRVQTLGVWNTLFDFEIRDMKDLSRLYDVVDSQDLEQLKDALFIEKKKMCSASVECHTKEGNRWLEFETDLFYDYQKEPTDKIIRIKDVTKYKIQNEELCYMAYYDAVTGLYNRNYFIRSLAEFIRKAEKENEIVSVMFIDVDDFRMINDGMGMLIGDELVQQIGQYLGEFQDEDVIISHMGGAIYCIAVYAPCGEKSVEHIYASIIERVKDGFYLTGGEEIYITVSVGVAEYPEASDSALELINCAEIVMFRAKQHGKNTIQYFDIPILNDFIQTVKIENKLKNTVYDDHFIMHFQPQYFSDNVKLRGVEALIRWQDEDGKMLSPAVFIPIAEKNGTIVPIGNWVIEKSVADFKEWKDKYGYPMTLSINISAIQYKREDFVENLLYVLNKYDISPSEIELEITESVLIDDPEEVKEKLQLLRDYGVRVSLDDFGTGFSSLAYLKGLPIDTLKIDKSFIDSVLNDRSSKIIVESMINMVKKLGIETIAEGVETEEQYKYLKAVGCDAIQGFYLGHPEPAPKIENLLFQLL